MYSKIRNEADLHVLDLYNIVFDKRFHLDRTHQPADYISEKVELDRPVVLSDVPKFFIDFMQNNNLGLISTKHLMVADQNSEGIFHPDAILLAGMASAAVDFPKTGKKVI